MRFAAAERVLSGTPSAAGSYRLTYRATDEQDLSATLKFTVTVIGQIGDSPATATVIRPGAPIRGRFEPGTDAHYFEVEVQSPARLIAATDRNPRYAATVVGIEGVPGHEPNTSESIDAVQDVAPGTYHVRVQLHPDGSHSSNEYALAVWVLGPENDTFDIDDLLIYVYLEHLDGPAGRGGPCFLRSARADGVPGLPFMGTMWFDPKHLSADALHFTALHEIGHVLGFGTLWDDFGYLQDPAGAAASRSPDTHFGGALATAAFNLAGGTSYPGAKVPVENDSARYPGAQDLHWRESVFGNELMTGGVRGIRGTFEPLSSVTVASLADLGYAVNYAAADAFRLPRPASALRDALQRGTIHFRGDTFPEPPTVVEMPENVVRVLDRD